MPSRGLEDSKEFLITSLHREKNTDSSNCKVCAGINSQSRGWVQKNPFNQNRWWKFSFARTKADPASNFRRGGDFSNICQSSELRVHYCKRDEVYFTVLLWKNKRRRNGLISWILFSEFVQNLVEKCYFRRF